MKGLTDIPGIRVGHASDFKALTGCTVILCDGGAVAGYDIRGSATGTEEFEIMNPQHLTSRIHALVFAGGSAFGLEACSGVRNFLESKGIGFPTGVARVPLVPGAILYDLGIGDPKVRPTREMGAAAAAAATDGPVAEGSIGAGTGATVGKLRGIQCAMKSGVGTFTLTLGGGNRPLSVSALAAVNPFGDVVDPKLRKIIAGARVSPDSKEFADTAESLKKGARGGFQQNTTLVAVATNARLTKVQAAKVSQLAQHGMVRTISPVHTMNDGDLIVTLAMGDEPADITALGVAAAEAVENAILRAVRSASDAGGLPGLATKN